MSRSPIAPIGFASGATRARIPLRAAALACALGACTDTRPEEPPPRPQTTRRHVVPAAWDSLWRRGGGTTEDTLLLMPLAVTADSARVYLLDAAARRVVALGADDGRLVWTAGRKGRGPGEFTSPIAIAPLAGGVVVADPGNGRLSVLDRSGLVIREVTFPEAAEAHSLCPLASGELLVSTIADERPLLLLRADGAVAARLALPWTDLADVPPLARQIRLGRAGAGGGCVVALELGRGFTTYVDGAFSPPRPYVERLELPRVEVTRSWRTRVQRLTERQIAAYDIAADGDEIAMAFEGRTRDARRLVDVYEATTGRYRHSLRLAQPVGNLARWRDRFYVVSDVDGYPTLTAYRARGAPTAPGAPMR